MQVLFVARTMFQLNDMLKSLSPKGKKGKKILSKVNILARFRRFFVTFPCDNLRANSKSCRVMKCKFKKNTVN